jgi:hypothetical protein
VRYQAHRVRLPELGVLEVDQAEVEARRGGELDYLSRGELHENAEV